MKVLWFTNTPALAEEIKGIKGIYGGSWIKSLQKALIDTYDIELGVAFHSKNIREKFSEGKTTYYPICNSNNLFKKITDRALLRITSEADILQYMDIVNDFSPQVIHIHGTEQSFGLIQRHNLDMPVVVSLQGNITVYCSKFYSGIPKEFVRKHSSLISLIRRNNYNCSKNILEKIKIREKEIFSLSKYLIGRTDWDRRISKILAPNSRYFHNDEILRHSFYTKKWVAPNNDVFTIFTTTSNALYKGFETILEVVQLLERKHINFVWNIAGISSGDKIVKIASSFLKAEISGKINLLGKVGEDDIIQNLLISNLYVMPSHIENSPNSLAEAMILGVPCIATHAGGTGSLLKNNETGYLIQDGDPWMLAGTILEVMEGYDDAISLGTSARTISLKRHNKKDIITSLLDIYTQILQANDKKT